MKKYTMSLPLSFVSDQESVSFHVKSADYFGTIATIISLWKQTGKINEKSFKELYDDLIDLQNNYEIKKKPQ